jgi:NAD(P)-dependent dehydrogenase (short-subunit alcohol dehydrogenase family)
MGEFAGKVVIVTGGSRGIGRAIAETFAREGAQTVLAALSADTLDKTAGEIASIGPRPLTCAVDLRTLDNCRKFFDFVREKLNRCDILINNAGATRGGPFLELDDALWIDGFALKFFAAVRLSRLFWPMLKAAQGHVVNIIGGRARTPHPEFLIGGPVNSALSNFNHGLSGLGKLDGVNVNAIHPGHTETERLWETWSQRSETTGRTHEEMRKEMLATLGIRRLATPQDIAELALFLCSERARQIQGVGIAVDGGATPGLY